MATPAPAEGAPPEEDVTARELLRRFRRRRALGLLPGGAAGPAAALSAERRAALLSCAAFGYGAEEAAATAAQGGGATDGGGAWGVSAGSVDVWYVRGVRDTRAQCAKGAPSVRRALFDAAEPGAASQGPRSQNPAPSHEPASVASVVVQINAANSGRMWSNFG